MERREFLLAGHLEAGTLEAWIEAGWLLPRGSGEAGPFSESISHARNSSAIWKNSA
jgi:hypothetical protein